jgi:hypothetical protein
MANISVSVTDANNITVQLTPVAVQTITIDRGVTGATGATGAGVAAGGTTGQVLSKASNTNYDTAWTTITGTLNYQGAWNASTNTPTLVSSVGTNSYYYVVSVAGSTNLNGITDWQIGDWAIFNGTIWQKIDQTNLVTSVNGQTGAVSVGTVTSVAATAGTGISITGSPITTSGTLNIVNTAPDQTVALTGAGTTTITGTYPNFVVTSNDAYTGTVTAVTGTAPISSSGGATPAISMAAATAIVNGYLTSSDWTTFNNKGSGTVTSISASVPTGLSISGSPITTSGTLAITYTAGYAIPTTTSQTNWDTAYTERLQWDGGSTGLVAATGRTSLGLVIGTDVLAPNGSAAALTSFPTLNQNTTGTAANVTGIVAIANGGTGATTLAGASIATYTGTETLTNKRIDPRVTTATSASSLTPSVATADVYAYTALAAGLTINVPTGTPVDGDKLMFRLLDNGTPQTLTWNPTFTVIGVTLPTTTTASKTTYVGCIYNSNATRWDVIAVTTQA